MRRCISADGAGIIQYRYHYQEYRDGVASVRRPAGGGVGEPARPPPLPLNAPLTAGAANGRRVHSALTKLNRT